MNIHDIAITHYNEFCRTELNPLIKRVANHYKYLMSLLERGAELVPEISRDSRFAKLRRVYFQQAVPFDETAAAEELEKCCNSNCSFLECIDNSLSVWITYRDILNMSCQLFDEIIPKLEYELAMEKAERTNRLCDCIKPLIAYCDWLRRITVFTAVCLHEPLAWSKRMDAVHLRRSFERNLFLRDNVLNAISPVQKEREDREITISLILQLT